MTLVGHEGAVSSAVFSPDGSSVLTASYDQTAKIWNATSGECMSTLVGHKHMVSSAVFSSDDSSVLTASLDETAKFICRLRECLMTFVGHEGAI